MMRRRTKTRKMRMPKTMVTSQLKVCDDLDHLQADTCSVLDLCTLPRPLHLTFVKSPKTDIDQLRRHQRSGKLLSLLKAMRTRRKPRMMTKRSQRQRSQRRQLLRMIPMPKLFQKKRMLRRMMINHLSFTFTLLSYLLLR
jgi:hypothetical protein